MSKVPPTQENKEKCFCPKCPTWLSDNCSKTENENLYCAAGKTACSLKKTGCLCSACPVYEDYNLDDGYFCLSGAAE